MPEDGVARLDGGEVYAHVGLAARMGLDVGVVRAEEGLGPLAREVLGHVDELAAAVVALARIALGVLIGEDRARGLHHRARSSSSRSR